MIVDCGGGTVDITVHEITNKEGQLKELFKATGGPYGSVSKSNAEKPNYQRNSIKKTYDFKYLICSSRG